jgi:CHAT domain-containing protein
VDVVHYAGHAVFDDARPERSALVLAGAGGAGALTAAQAAELDLRHVRLVVLSACQTLRARDGRAGGFAGFTRSLLAAGAGGVLGSLWRVDDERTRALMVAFHQAYRASGDGPGALRAAQLRLLRSADPALRSPAAWAGFRYAGA